MWKLCDRVLNVQEQEAVPLIPSEASGHSASSESPLKSRRHSNGTKGDSQEDAERETTQGEAAAAKASLEKNQASRHFVDGNRRGEDSSVQGRRICNDENHHYLMEESEMTLEEELELSGHFQKNSTSSFNPEIKGQDAGTGRHKWSIPGLYKIDKMPKIWNKYSQERNIGASVPISTLMCLWANYIFPQWVCLFCWRKYVHWSWYCINRSRTHECGNWGWGSAIPRKGIYKRNCRYSVVVLQYG